MVPPTEGLFVLSRFRKGIEDHLNTGIDILVYLGLAETQNGVAAGFQVGVFALVISLSFWKAMPVVAVALNNYLRFREPKITGESYYLSVRAVDRVLKNVINCDTIKRILHGGFYARRILAIQHAVSRTEAATTNRRAVGQGFTTSKTVGDRFRWQLSLLHIIASPRAIFASLSYSGIAKWTGAYQAVCDAVKAKFWVEFCVRRSATSRAVFRTPFQLTLCEWALACYAICNGAGRVFAVVIPQAFTRTVFVPVIDLAGCQRFVAHLASGSRRGEGLFAYARTGCRATFTSTLKLPFCQGFIANHAGSNACRWQRTCAYTGADLRAMLLRVLYVAFGEGVATHQAVKNVTARVLSERLITTFFGTAFSARPGGLKRLTTDNALLSGDAFSGRAFGGFTSVRAVLMGAVWSRASLPPIYSWGSWATAIKAYAASKFHSFLLSTKDRQMGWGTGVEARWSVTDHVTIAPPIIAQMRCGYA